VFIPETSLNGDEFKSFLYENANTYWSKKYLLGSLREINLPKTSSVYSFKRYSLIRTEPFEIG
jgi:hypothetical protein